MGQVSFTASTAIYFQDSIFPATRCVREQLLPLLHDSGRPWGCQLFLPTLSRKLVRLLAEHGCGYVYTGIESGSSDLRAAVGKPGLRDSLVRERLLWIAGEGLRLGLSLMFGILDASGALFENEGTVAETLTFADRCMKGGMFIESFYPNVMTVLPGTPLAMAYEAAGGLDFYSMPRTHEFAELEEGEIGYNFASLCSRTRELQHVASAIAEASSALSIWRHSG